MKYHASIEAKYIYNKTLLENIDLLRLVWYQFLRSAINEKSVADLSVHETSIGFNISDLGKAMFLLLSEKV